LATLSQTFQDTPPDLKAAVDGVARFSQTLDTRDQQLRNLLANANKAPPCFLSALIRWPGSSPIPNALLAQLPDSKRCVGPGFGQPVGLRQAAIRLHPRQPGTAASRLDKLNGVLTIVDDRKERIQQAIKSLNAYAMSLGEAVASGPFFKAYLANLLPGQFVQPFVDSAFSDLGLGSQRALAVGARRPADRPVATPALPVPYPRGPRWRAQSHAARRDYRESR